MMMDVWSDFYMDHLRWIWLNIIIFNFVPKKTCMLTTFDILQWWTGFYDNKRLSYVNLAESFLWTYMKGHFNKKKETCGKFYERVYQSIGKTGVHSDRILIFLKKLKHKFLEMILFKNEAASGHHSQSVLNLLKFDVYEKKVLNWTNLFQ